MQHGGEDGTGPEIRFADGVPIPPNVRPVIFTHGTDHEIGYQWFQQYVQIFGPWILEGLRRDLSVEERAVLGEYQGHIQNHVPECIGLMRGMAAGATAAGVPLSYDEVLTCFVNEQPIIGTDPGQDVSVLVPPARCSGYAAWGSTTKDGGLLAVGIGDMAEVKFEVTVVVIPRSGEGNVFVLAPYEMSGKPCHPAMNDRGLVHVHHGAGTSGNEHARDGSLEAAGVPTFFGIMHTLRYADTAAEALRLQTSYPGHAGGMWADTTGDAFVLECRDPLVVRRAGDAGETDFLYATNNVISRDERLGAFLPRHPTLPTRYVEHAGYLAHGGTISSIPRNLQMYDLLSNYHALVDIEFAKMTCRFGGSPPDHPTLEEADAGYYDTQGKGWDQTIAGLSAEMVGIMVPEEKLCYLSSFTLGRAAQAHGPGGHYYPVEPTYSFYQLKLDADPARMVTIAKERCRYDLYYAHQVLRKLTCWDPPYAPLHGLFDRAATEWVKGGFYLVRAALTAGNESVCDHGRAVRAFTRGQAYANQVHESLVPPPTTPADLGLREWGGSWADWRSAQKGRSSGTRR
jgi:hypothetical protein